MFVPPWEYCGKPAQQVRSRGGAEGLEGGDFARKGTKEPKEEQGSGRDGGIETVKTASRTSKGGRRADDLPERGRLARNREYEHK